MMNKAGLDFNASDEEFAHECGRVSFAIYHQDIFQALEIITNLRIRYPNSTTVYELYGDVLFHQRKYNEALQAYRKALELEPANIDADRKIAQVIFQLNRRDFQPKQDKEKTISPARARRNAKYAMTASILIPGLGQVYNGENLKGILMILLYYPLLSWAGWGIIRLYLNSICLYRYYYHSFTPKLLLSSSQEVGYMLAITGFLALIIFSAWDARHQALRNAAINHADK